MRAARALAALVLAAVVAGCGGSRHQPASQFGAAPAPSAAPSESAGPTPTFTFNPSPGPTGSASPSVPSGNSGQGDLRATYHAQRDVLGTRLNVTVTLSNQGTGDVNGWTVIVGLSSINLTVSTPPQIKHEVKDGKLVFTPNGAGDLLHPGDELTFSFTATGLGSVTSCTANGRDCVSA